MKRMLTEEWLRKAEADMAVAERLVAEDAAFSNAVAFHSQQSTEKYLKAFLTWAQIDFPKTHDIAELLDLMATANPPVAACLREATDLTPYAAEIRYPGDRPDASVEDARQAVRLAQKVRDTVLPLLPSPA